MTNLGEPAHELDYFRVDLGEQADFMAAIKTGAEDPEQIISTAVYLFAAFNPFLGLPKRSISAAAAQNLSLTRVNSKENESLPRLSRSWSVYGDALLQLGSIGLITEVPIIITQQQLFDPNPDNIVQLRSKKAA